MNEVISMPLMGLSAKSESLAKWLMAACLAIGLLSQKSFAAKYETEANIAKISHADSVIIFTNMGDCGKDDARISNDRCIVDSENVVCRNAKVLCSDLPHSIWWYPQTTIKISGKSDKESLRKFIRSQVFPRPKNYADSMFRCFSIKCMIEIHLKKKVIHLDYDGVNRLLGGMRVKDGFLEELLKRYKQRRKDDSGC